MNRLPRGAVRIVEGKPVVVAVAPASQDLAVGDVIRAVDGEIEGADGVRQVVLRREGSPPRLPRVSSEPFRLLKPGIGYVDTSLLLTADVEQMFEKLRSTRAIIFDLRRVGAHALRDMILPRLTETVGQSCLP